MLKEKAEVVLAYNATVSEYWSDANILGLENKALPLELIAKEPELDATQLAAVETFIEELSDATAAHVQ